ncbi:Nucleoside-specific outer membrane channel protein Tsx [Ferrimonas sediminum]|uniref:Nucleoside-specific outer membrane channel protein Tsx n=2 Tax=Ferrimonas sediminum TaxID=718193 RepID=A0A1G8Y092_9GAMM|nr:Nucleoside-specific outer membrane channel protein Tsx [Ferrimonas sediminum]
MMAGGNNKVDPTMKKTTLALALLASMSAYAESPIQWWDASATLLHGEDYDLAPSHRQTTLTLETAGGWSYGDWFAFYDFIEFNGTSESASYGEISPRFSFGKMLGTDLGMGPVTDLSLALTYETGKGPVESFLYGVGADLALPGFTYFQLNAYKRDAISDGNISDGWQLTPVFRVDIPVGDANLVVDGFIDWVVAADNDGYEENLHFNPQIKYDLGRSLFGEAKSNTLLVGIEYDYWQNKYGVDGIDQNTYSFIVKYHL